MRYWLVPMLLSLVLPLPAAQAATEGLAERAAQAAFTAIEQELINEFFGKQPPPPESDAGKAKKDKDGKSGKGKGLPPGLAKRDDLPPGLQKQLEKNGTLPPGLAKRDLPADLERRLPARSKGQERVIVDNDVVLVETATGIVLDILYDVVRGE
ncbi:MAG TPA: hypothetical protein VIX81_06575 [Gammaproteobacteria bacterium]